MSQKILILGATGFVGQHLARALAAGTWAVPLAAGRSARVSGIDAAGSVQTLRLDATEEAALSRALQGVDGVVNCIAGSATTMTTSTRVLVNAASRQQTPPRIVHLSSMAVYGPATGLIDESAPLSGVDAYAQAKITTEQLCVPYARSVILRPGIVYGPGGPQWTARIARWLHARRLGDLGAAGDGCCNLLYVEDLVTAISQALRLNGVEGRTFNLAMSEPPTWNEYFVRFAQALGAVPVARLGRRRLKFESKILAPPLKIAEILSARAGLRSLRLPEAIPPSLLRLCQQDIRLDIHAAERGLQLSWTTLEAGLAAAAAWCRQHLGREAQAS
jgi:nucleoside-diphosphate-sugar epimerase